MVDAARSPAGSEFTESQSLLDELNGVVKAGDAKQKRRILDRVTDLFAAGSRGYSGTQIALFDDVLQKLAADIEVAARAKLSGRLAFIGNAPPRLIRLLAFDDAIEVAEPVLAHSAQLSDADLAENAATKSQAHLFAIAQRLSLSETVTDVLVDRGDRKVIHRVVKNRGARFSLAGYDKLTVRARNDHKLTLALGRRSDLPRQCFLKLLESASAAVRQKLEAANPAAAAAIRDTVDEVASDMQRQARESSDRFASARRDAKTRFNVRPFTEANIHASAHAQEFERTVVALTKFGHFPVDLVERALLDKGEDMVLILARAAGCSWTTARALLLMYSAERDLQPDELERCFESYRKLTQKTARNIIDFYERRVEQRSRPKPPRRVADAGSAQP
jgi:uncharacterized protein (DUF2336 family)